MSWSIKQEKHSEEEPDYTVKLKTSHVPILINWNGCTTYSNCSSYDKTKAATSFVWHLIIVHHEGKAGKVQILKALVDAVAENDFYPVAYREGKKYDDFLVRNCKLALQKLFEHKLQIPVGRDRMVRLTVKFNVGCYETDQICHAERMSAAVLRQFTKLESTENISAILNLENFSALPELADVCILLRSKSAFDLLCKTIAQNKEVIRTIRGLKLNKNGITSLSSLQYLSKGSLKLLDLRYNAIDCIQQLNHLKPLSLIALYISGNKCSEKLMYLNDAKNILPNVQILDGVQTHKIIHNKRSNGIELEFPGDVITTYDIKEEPFLLNYKRSDMWHQIIVLHRGSYSKDVIVKSLYASVQACNSPMFICYYEVGQEEDTFLVRNSIVHLEIFLANKLKLKILDETDTVQMQLKMNVAYFKQGHIDPIEMMLSITRDRYNIIDRTLNLEMFAKSKELRNLTISLSSAAILTTLLIQTGRRYAAAVDIRLANNEIVSSQGMHGLHYFKRLKVLDLSHNKIKTIHNLKDIPTNAIKEIMLHGNPLCANYSMPEEYIKEVQKVFPEIVKLDGVDLKALASTCRTQKNYLCNVQGYNLVEQFVSAYFKMYDTRERISLCEMYSKSAILSMSFLWKNLAFDDERLRLYSGVSRNNMFTYTDENIYFGQKEIGKILENLPKTEHDRFSFSIDCPYLTDDVVCIQVSGMFREKTESALDYDLAFSFKRTFTLVASKTNLGTYGSSTEYKIMSDLYHVQNPSDFELKPAFKYIKTESSAKELKPEDKEVLTCIFQKLTSLKLLWCSRFFGDAQWNFAKALEIYVQFKTEKKLPANAFVSKAIE